MNLKSGTHLQSGRYCILETLGRGGFGITYLAEQVMTKRKVCIKEFFPKDYYKREGNTTSIALSSDGFAASMNRFKAKFIKETQTIASLEHSNIIHIHDAFEENGTAYYVMEYIEGDSLSDIVKRSGALDEAMEIDIETALQQEQEVVEHDVDSPKPRRRSKRILLWLLLIVAVVGGITYYMYGKTKIYYTTSDGMMLQLRGNFDAWIVSHTYENGQGVIEFYGNVTEIGDYEFYECFSLTSVTIPDSVTTIRDWAFTYCDNLTSVTIPDSVTTIGDYAFYDCDSLTSVTIPDSVRTIGEHAFYDCDSLTSVTIPDSLTTIRIGAFSYCDNLTSVTIPDSVTTIGVHTFYGCSALKSVTISDSVTAIGDGVFYGCSALESVTIPNSVMTIGDSAFYDCDSLTSVTIPDSVTTIEEDAFYDCDSLTSVSIPDSVTTIEDGAFYECNNLSEETKNKINSIKSEAF